MGQTTSSKHLSRPAGGDKGVRLQHVLSEIEEEIKNARKDVDEQAQKKTITQHDVQLLRQALSTAEQQFHERIKYLNWGKEIKDKQHGGSGTSATQKIPFDKVVEKLKTECSRWTELKKNLQQNKTSAGLSTQYIISELEETRAVLHDMASADIPLSTRLASPTGFTTRRSASKSSAIPKQDTQTNVESKNEVTLLQGRIRKLEKEIKQLKEYNENQEGKANSKADELAYEQQKHKETKIYLNHTKEEQREGLLRLSKVVGEKLSENNPNIADLSDKNRPTKLGEMYSELYDNEWTDAYDALQLTQHTDTDIIRTLKATLDDVHCFCEKNSKLFTEKVKEAINLEFVNGQAQSGSKDHRGNAQLTIRWKPKKGRLNPVQETQMETKPIDASTQIKTLGKEVAVSMVPIVQKKYLDQMWDEDCVPGMKPYIKKCLYLCWMMISQSPPMCFTADPQPGELLDTDVYKQYMSTGKYVDYVVWPALTLHKGGPIVCKGVLQAKSAKSSR